ncbi:hypothetical protein EUTSA_v100093450mg, partial [Eutrema salsugineum]
TTLFFLKNSNTSSPNSRSLRRTRRYLRRFLRPDARVRQFLVLSADMMPQFLVDKSLDWNERVKTTSQDLDLVIIITYKKKSQ